MKINAEFDQRVVVHSSIYDSAEEWLSSPMAGVSRRPLDRVGADVARATSLVRYSPGSEFSSHVHTGGEEFIVLDGIFQDEHGDYPVGSYIRNPPQSSHTPSSKSGCVIFVKLWQFAPDDRTHVRLNISAITPLKDSGMLGVSVIPLHTDKFEHVSVYRCMPGAHFELNADEGAEVFVLEGSVLDGGDQLRKHSWLRLPTASKLHATAGEDGATVWVKQNHLANVAAQVELVLDYGRIDR